MIDINFLTPWKVAGMEFMDFQNRNFYNELRDMFESYITYADGKANLKGSVEDDLYTIIKTYTGFDNIKLKLVDWGNFAVDTAYFSPKNILNNDFAEDYFGPTGSSLAKWFTTNKNKVFKGTIDFKTGKVGGAFSAIPVELYINRNLSSTFPDDMIKKYQTNIASLCAGVIVHEMGHIFGGCAMINQQAMDNFIIKAVIQGAQKVERREELYVIIKDATKLLELENLDDKDIQAILDSKDPQLGTLMYFTKMITQRNTRRSLSLGVPVMTSEVLADAYAIRMGCDRGLMPALAILYQTQRTGIKKSAWWLTFFAWVTIQVTSNLFSVLIGTASTLAGGVIMLVLPWLIMYSLFYILIYMEANYAGIYNTDHRRYEDAIRQLIARFKEDTNMPSNDRATLLKELDRYLAINKEMKPIIDNTVIYRFFGWLGNGSDFKRSEFEHYTQVIANHEINLLGDKLGGLIAKGN